MTNYICGVNAIHEVYGSQPVIVLSGTEGSGITIGIRENAGNLEYGTVTVSGTAPNITVTWGTTLASLGGTNPVRWKGTIPVGFTDVAATDWEYPIFVSPTNSTWTVLAAGLVPSAAFGQATNYDTFALVNKGTNGAGTTTLASAAFSSAATVLAKNTLGTISTPTVASNEVLTIKKTHTSSGQILPTGSMFYVELTRTT